MKAYAACATYAVVVAGLVFTVFTVGRFPTASLPQRGGQDLLSVVFGDARSVLSSALYHKADSYFHGGIDMDGGHDCVFHGEKGHSHETHHHEGNRDLVEADAKKSFDPWKWINTRIRAPQIERHLEGKKAGELVPILWASVKADPKNVEAWTTAWYIGAIVMNDVALGDRILAEGLSKNPDSAELRFFQARAIYNGGKGDRVRAQIMMLQVQELLLKRCAHDETRLSAEDAETLHHTRLFLEAFKKESARTGRIRIVDEKE